MGRNVHGKNGCGGCRRRNIGFGPDGGREMTTLTWKRRLSLDLGRSADDRGSSLLTQLVRVRTEAPLAIRLLTL